MTKTANTKNALDFHTESKLCIILYSEGTKVYDWLLQLRRSSIKLKCVIQNRPQLAGDYVRTVHEGLIRFYRFREQMNQFSYNIYLSRHLKHTNIIWLRI